MLVNKFHYRKGGAETYYFEIGSALQDMGHEVAYFSMHHPNNLSCDQERYFVTQREYNDVRNPFKAVADGLALVYSFEAKRNFQALCDDFRPDVIHLNNVHRQITLSILDVPYLNEHHIPVVYTAHDYVTICPGYLMLDGQGRVCDRCLEDGRYRHCIENKCIKGSRSKSALAALEAFFNRSRHMNDRIDRVIAPSRFMAEKLLEGGWPEDKVTVLQNFASDAILDRARTGGLDQTDREHPYLLYFGRISKEKGVGMLLDAFLAAMPFLQGWRLVIAGDGPEFGALKDKVRSLGPRCSVELVGYQRSERLQNYVGRASLAVTNSMCRENMPFSVIEAFAAGTPVVGSRIGGIPELVSEGETGFLCEPGDVSSLTKAIIRGVSFCGDLDAYRAMQGRCRDYVVENCDQSHFMERLVEIYQKEIEIKRC
nr:glycosyltransferase family 4 protein [Collinsella tanakaei]